MVEAECIDAPGELTEPEDLEVEKAVELYQTLSAGIHRYVSLVEVRRTTKGDVIVYDIEPEVPQYPVYPIQEVERIASLFFDEDDRVPRTLALRRDFPVVPHLQLEEEEFPRSLCLYDAPYPDICRSWTAGRYLRRVFEWLCRTARGELHAEDQPLEPLLQSSPIPIVLPGELWEEGDGEERALHVWGTARDGDSIPRALFAAESAEKEPAFLALTITTDPQQHGVIRRIPQYLEELADVLKDANCDLKGILTDQLKTYEGERASFREARLILVVQLPKRREPEGPIEDIEVQAFLVMQTVEGLGEALGIWQRDPDGTVGRILDTSDDSFRGDQVGVIQLNPVKELTQPRARELSGIGDRDPGKVTAIGVGALGSQVVVNLNTMGWGRWTLVDRDMLMPHNLVRHALPFWADGAPYVGKPKAEAMAHLLASQYFRPLEVCGVDANVLERPASEDVQEAMDRADVILDFSASVSVARHVGAQPGVRARRSSVFLNPQGTDLVILCEDEDRNFPIHVLEAQYHRAHLSLEELDSHLEPPDDQFRYGHNCRDVTSRLPQDRVALHAGQATRAIHRAVERPEPTIKIFSALEDGSVDIFPVEVVQWYEQIEGGWTIRWDDAVNNRMRRLREERLPAETGGVLLGIHDFERREVFIIEALAAPSDSVEMARPPGFIRGAAGLRETVEQLRERSAQTVSYAGEWHSHPRGAGGALSGDDQDILSWMWEYLRKDGLPAVMGVIWDGGIAWHARAASQTNS